MPNIRLEQQLDHNKKPLKVQDESIPLEVSTNKLWYEKHQQNHMNWQIKNMLMIILVVVLIGHHNGHKDIILIQIVG